MTFNINWDKKGVYVKFRGTVTAQDLIDANNYVLSNANFDSISYQIFDFLHIDEFKITSHDISIVATMDRSESESTNEMMIAILTRDDYVKKISLEYKTLMTGSNWKTEIFEDIEDAKKWTKS